ncbi:hypothetical protein ERJ75_001258100 [Trypanosoma vivax]|nr:hypothetical protein ERJ75_001258100 [Trypanosoma vivax]
MSRDCLLSGGLEDVGNQQFVPALLMATGPLIRGIRSLATDFRTLRVAGKAAEALHEHHFFVKRIAACEGDRLEYMAFAVPGNERHSVAKKTGGVTAIACKVFEAKAN